MRDNRSSKPETNFDFNFNRVFSSLCTSVSFWKPIVRNEVPSREQFEKERQETHLAIESSDQAIERSKELLSSLQGESFRKSA